MSFAKFMEDINTEIKVMQALWEGKQPSEICKELGLQPKKVYDAMQRMGIKLIGRYPKHLRHLRKMIIRRNFGKKNIIL